MAIRTWFRYELRKIIYLILSLVLFIHGCAFNIIGREFGQAIVHDFERKFPDMEKLTNTLNAFYEENKRWPNNFDELKEFAQKNKMDLQLNLIRNIKFKSLEDGKLSIDYDYPTTMFSELGLGDEPIVGHGTFFMPRLQSKDKNKSSNVNKQVKIGDIPLGDTK